MQPRNNLDREVLSLSKGLPKIGKRILDEAYKVCFEPIARATKCKTVCYECGHQWRADNSKISHKDIVTCPNCKKQLSIAYTPKSFFNYKTYFDVITVCGRFQVIRKLLFSKYYHLNTTERGGYKEYAQYWIDTENKKMICLGINTFMNQYSHSSELSIKMPRSTSYDINPWAISKYMKIHPIITRNGFAGDFHMLEPQSLFLYLIKMPIAETLIKAEQYTLLQGYVNETLDDKYWPQIKLCIRNNYKVIDYKMWKDHLQLLTQLGRDIFNAKNVCPKDLSAEHTRLTKILRDKIRKEDKAKQIKHIMEYDIAYQQYRQKFFDLMFEEDELKVVPLKSVEEFYDIGEEHEHCIFTNSYYKRSDSLLFKAIVHGKLMETIEFSFKQKAVTQCHGWRNKNTDIHNRIIELVNRNTPKIMKIAKSKQKRINKQKLQEAV